MPRSKVQLCRIGKKTKMNLRLTKLKMKGDIDAGGSTLALQNVSTLKLIATFIN